MKITITTTDTGVIFRCANDSPLISLVGITDTVSDAFRRLEQRLARATTPNETSSPATPVNRASQTKGTQ